MKITRCDHEVNNFMKNKLIFESLGKRIRFIITILFLINLTVSCSHPRYIRSSNSDQFQSLNARTLNGYCTVILNDGTKYEARHLVLTEDTTVWYIGDTAKLIQMPTQEIKTITLMSRGDGFADGVGIGLGIGAAIAAICGLTAEDRDCSDNGQEWCFTRSSVFWFAIIFIGLPSGVLGGLTGTVIGAKHVYHPFPDESNH